MAEFLYTYSERYKASIQQKKCVFWKIDIDLFYCQAHNGRSFPQKFAIIV